VGGRCQRRRACVNVGVGLRALLLWDRHLDDVASMPSVPVLVAAGARGVCGSLGLGPLGGLARIEGRWPRHGDGMRIWEQMISRYWGRELGGAGSWWVEAGSLISTKVGGGSRVKRVILPGDRAK
jgi:hypothetical protein